VNQRGYWVFARYGLLIGLSVLVAAGRASSSTAPVASDPNGPSSVELIDIDGLINPASAEFIVESIARSGTDNSAALVIELDTPGGLLTSAQQIVKAMLNSPVPVIVYVAPSGASATSAGTFVTMAANIAAMAPGTTIGAAHPVEMGGGDVKGAMGTKIENFTASFARTIAHQRRRNEEWVDQAVRQSVSISEREALKKHVIDLIASDLTNLLAQASGRQVKVSGGRIVTLNLVGAAIHRSKMRLGEAILNRLADPNIMYLLMLAGVVGLYFEFAHPGVYLPGVAGAICLLLALASFEVIPINLAGLLLILLGTGLLMAELFVTSYGVMGLGGVIAFVLGSLFLVDTSQTNVEVNRKIIAGGAIAFATIILGIGYIAFRERRGRPTTGQEGLIGQIGLVREPIAPGTPGRIFVHGEIWRAVSDAPIEVGTRACVIGVRGLEVIVRPATALDR
jgi:membrane-bound serine protease (ClpP class)